MKKSVGLVVMTYITQEGKEVLVAVLQKRGTFNTEKMEPESYPDCCQVTCHGKLKDKEGWGEGLLREITEELGPVFSSIVHHGQSTVLIETDTILTMGIFTSIVNIRNHIRLDPDTGGLVYITKDQVDNIVEISGDMKIHGPEFTHTLAMFPDEIEAVRKAFEIFRRI